MVVYIEALPYYLGAAFSIFFFVMLIGLYVCEAEEFDFQAE